MPQGSLICTWDGTGSLICTWDGTGSLICTWDGTGVSHLHLRWHRGVSSAPEMAQGSLICTWDGTDPQHSQRTPAVVVFLSGIAAGERFFFFDRAGKNHLHQLLFLCPRITVIGFGRHVDQCQSSCRLGGPWRNWWDFCVRTSFVSDSDRSYSFWITENRQQFNSGPVLRGGRNRGFPAHHYCGGRLCRTGTWCHKLPGPVPQRRKFHMSVRPSQLWPRLWLFWYLFENRGNLQYELDRFSNSAYTGQRQ